MVRVWTGGGTTWWSGVCKLIGEGALGLFGVKKHCLGGEVVMVVPLRTRLSLAHGYSE